MYSWPPTRPSSGENDHERLQQFCGHSFRICILIILIAASLKNAMQSVDLNGIRRSNTILSNYRYTLYVTSLTWSIENIRIFPYTHTKSDEFWQVWVFILPQTLFLAQKEMESPQIHFALNLKMIWTHCFEKNNCIHLSICYNKVKFSPWGLKKILTQSQTLPFKSEQ